MWKLIVKEKTGIVGGWLEVDGETYEVLVGDTQEDFERAEDTLIEWSNWMDKEIESVQEVSNGRGGGLSIRPCMVESIALVYKRS